MRKDDRSLAWRLARGALTLAATAALLVLAAGWLGGVHPAFDSIGHFRAHLAVFAFGLGLLTILAGPGALARTIGAAALALSLFAGWTVLPFVVPSGLVDVTTDGPRYTLLQMNLRYDAESVEALRRIGEVSPDVVTVQEVHLRWRPRLEALSDRYPHQFFCDGAYSVGDVAILSRRPFVGEPVCAYRDGLAARRVDFGGVTVTVVSEHLEWPWPFRHWRQIAALEPILADLPAPILVGGDFNAAPWSAAVRTFARVTGTRPVEGIGPTWQPRRLPRSWLPYLGLPIDSILASPEIKILSVERLAPTGSDHLPVLVTFTLDPPSPGDAPMTAGAARR